MQNYNSKSKILKNLKKELPEIQRNISLAKHTTFHIGGRARYFFEAKNKEDLIKAILAAKKFKLPFFILGNGSNLLVSDEGYKGLIINFQFSIFNFQKNKIISGAGTPLGKLINASVERSLTGLEWAMGIPGTVGGAIHGNAGSFSSSMKDIVKSVEVLDVQDFQFSIFNFQFSKKSQIPNPKLKIKILQNKDCKFGYRDSIFKENKNLIILSAELQLKKGNKKEIEGKIKEYLNYRKTKQPLDFPSAGSIFQNQKSKIKNQKLLTKYPELKAFNGKSEIPTGWLIEKCGLKGKRIGNAKISEKHANFIVNLGGAKSADVKKLIALAKKEVKKKFKIKLEEEIQYL